MIRGEIWWVRFPFSEGGEIKKTRPAIIVSNDASNRYLNRVQIVPLTSSTRRIYPSEAFIEWKGRPAKAIASQVTTAAKSRLLRLAGRLNQDAMMGVDRALALQLGLNSGYRSE